MLTLSEYCELAGYSELLQVMQSGDIDEEEMELVDKAIEQLEVVQVAAEQAAARGFECGWIIIVQEAAALLDRITGYAEPDALLMLN